MPARCFWNGAPLSSARAVGFMVFARGDSENTGRSRSPKKCRRVITWQVQDSFLSIRQADTRFVPGTPRPDGRCQKVRLCDLIVQEARVWGSLVMGEPVLRAWHRGGDRRGGN